MFSPACLSTGKFGAFFGTFAGISGRNLIFRQICRKICAAKNLRNQLIVNGGEGGIRTPGTLASPAVFKTAAIDHSATSPSFAHVIQDWILGTFANESAPDKAAISCDFVGISIREQATGGCAILYFDERTHSLTAIRSQVPIVP